MAEEAASIVAVRVRVAQLRAEAAEARARARTYYEVADERERRGSGHGALACCELGWMATEKALALEAEADRLAAAHGLEEPWPGPASLHPAAPACPACGGVASPGAREAAGGYCSASCQVTAARGGLIARPTARA